MAHANHGPYPAPNQAVEDDHQDIWDELDEEELGPVVVDHHVHLVHPELGEAKYVISIFLKRIIGNFSRQLMDLFTPDNNTEIEADLLFKLFICLAR